MVTIKRLLALDQSFARLYEEDFPLADFCRQLESWERIQALHNTLAAKLDHPPLKRFWHGIPLIADLKASSCILDVDTVCIGAPRDITEKQRTDLRTALTGLMPWRKGPFNFFGIPVESEWQSSLKWQRVMKLVQPDLSDKIIADVGCNNTYYMLRMLPHRPRLVLGLDPVERYYYYYLLVQNFIQAPELAFEMMGVDELDLFPRFFDVVFFMGILYHRRNPISALEKAAACLKSGGLLILESAGIEGDEPLCLFPGKRYMKAPGYWFLPTVPALRNMLSRSGFNHLRIHGSFPTSRQEQRKTAWVNTESLEDFLDPSDPAKTVEGYPAPIRIYMSARRS